MLKHDSVTSIGGRAFYNCSFLTSITFNGTKAQWNSIELGDNWKGNWKLRIAAQRVHCTDGKVKIWLIDRCAVDRAEPCISHCVAT
jgi:hypothetical protein